MSWSTFAFKANGDSVAIRLRKANSWSNYPYIVQDSRSNMNCEKCNCDPCNCIPPYPNKLMSEHDTITSRTTGRKLEISMGIHGDGLVPRNPFASQAQAGFMHTHPEILGKEGLKEWDQATKGKHLPKHVKKG